MIRKYWLIALLFLLLPGCKRETEIRVTNADSAGAKTQPSLNRSAQLEAQETQMDQTVWAKEMLAQQCGRIFETLSWPEVR